MVPVARVEGVPLKLFTALDRWKLWLVEQSQTTNDHVRFEDLALGGMDLPDPSRVIPSQRIDGDVRAEVSPQIIGVGYLLEVAQDLLLWSEGFRPIGFQVEREGVEV